ECELMFNFNIWSRLQDNFSALMAYLQKQTTGSQRGENSEEDGKHKCGMYRTEFFTEDYRKHGTSDHCREMEYDDSAPVEEVVCRVDDGPEGGMHEVELRGRKILIIRGKGI
ncbi:hypothetical protein PMAYCL1PPCAC_30581, partial [Pristionchus mayeri]